jgi:hypothetical protein
MKKFLLYFAAGFALFAIWQWRKSQRNQDVHDYMKGEENTQKRGQRASDTNLALMPALMAFVSRPTWDANPINNTKATAETAWSQLWFGYPDQPETLAGKEAWRN